IKIIVFTSSVHNHSFKIAAVLDKQVTNRHVNIFLTTMAQVLERYISKRINKERISSILSTTTVSSEESTCTAPKQLCIDFDDTFNDYNKENILD
ncbi:unnamed protein product, partial [Rotaria magnacalcarata]